MVGYGTNQRIRPKAAFPQPASLSDILTMTSECPELRSSRIVLRRPTRQDVQTRLLLGRHGKGYGAEAIRFALAYMFESGHAFGHCPGR